MAAATTSDIIARLLTLPDKLAQEGQILAQIGPDWPQMRQFLEISSSEQFVFKSKNVLKMIFRGLECSNFGRIGVKCDIPVLAPI